MTIPLLSQSGLLIVEGRDEQEFIRALCRECSMPVPDILDIGGKTKLTASLQALTLDAGFERVQRMGVIRDADDSAKAAFESVSLAVRRSGLPCPKRSGEFAAGTFRGGRVSVGILILPDGHSQGMLESLCVDATGDDPRMGIVEEFLRNGIQITTHDSDELDGPPRLRLVKARTQAFLALMPRVDCRVGIAASRGYWNLKHNAMKGLTSFVQSVAQ